MIRPHKVVLLYDDPERRTVLIDGDTIRMLWPSRTIDQRTNIGAAQRRIQHYFVDKSPAELRSHFDIAATVASGSPRTWWLVTMSPKRKQIKEGLATLELWLDRYDGDAHLDAHDVPERRHQADGLRGREGQPDDRPGAVSGAVAGSG